MTKEEYRRAVEQMWNSAGNMGDLSEVIPESWRGVVKMGGRVIRRVEDIPQEEWDALAQGTWRAPPIIWDDDESEIN